MEIDDTDVDSIGGWLYDELGREPHVGQMAAYGGNRFFVEEVDGVRITRVLVWLAQELTEVHEEIVGDET